MGLFTKDIKSMDDLFLHVLQDIYYAEKQIAEGAPRHGRKGHQPRAYGCLQSHLAETENMFSGLNRPSSYSAKSPKGTTCPAIDGIIKEANEIAGEVAEKKVLDAALITAAQAVEHYEITRYGTLIAWAEETRQRGCCEPLPRRSTRKRRPTRSSPRSPSEKSTVEGAS